MTTSQPTKPDVRFAVTIQDSSGNRYGGTQYRNFAARAYILARDKYRDDHAYELHSPDSYSVEAGPARVLAGLQITAQADDSTMRKPGDEWYAWTVSFDRSRVELRDAEDMLPVLRKIDKRIAKLTAELGQPGHARPVLCIRGQRDHRTAQRVHALHTGQPGLRGNRLPVHGCRRAELSPAVRRY